MRVNPGLLRTPQQRRKYLLQTGDEVVGLAGVLGEVLDLA